MVKKLLTGVAFCALATSAYADAPVNGGSVDGTLALRQCVNSDDTSCGMHFGYGVDGAYQFAFGSFTLQGDVRYEAYSGMEQAVDQVDGASTLGLHFAYRTDRWLGGVFASVASGGVYTEHWGQVYGGEFQWYSDSITYYGQIGYADINYDSLDNRFQGDFASIEVRYFIEDNTELSGGLGYGHSARGFEDAGDTGDASSFGITLKRQWSDSGFYYSLGYEASRFQANTEDEGSDDRFVFGVSMLFGGANSLKAADRQGATLRLPLLPSRAASWAEALD